MPVLRLVTEPWIESLTRWLKVSEATVGLRTDRLQDGTLIVVPKPLRHEFFGLQQNGSEIVAFGEHLGPSK
jgi:hypothetical protein